MYEPNPTAPHHNQDSELLAFEFAFNREPGVEPTEEEREYAAQVVESVWLAERLRAVRGNKPEPGGVTPT